MHHDVPLIATIAMSLMLAFAFGMAAVRLHLSPLVGYLVAGIILGPFTPGFSADLALAHQLAEIGVILLMFGVGLHFSIRDLWDVRWIAIPGAVAQITVATGLGAALAILWGWSLMAGIIFGLALSVASTVVLLRALEERHALQTLGEFSFILVALGVALGVLPLEGQTYILAGALLSIALNPLVFRLLGPMETWMRDHPRVINALERSGADPLTVLPAGMEPKGGHTVIVGFGRVGANIAQAFDRYQTPYVVVEHNRQLVQRLRKQGIGAIYGDAGVAGVLHAAHVGTASALVAAVPDSGQARRVVEFARACNPDIKLVVRTHSDAEREYMERQGVSQVVMGERELALAMTRYALARLEEGKQPPSGLTEACP